MNLNRITEDLKFYEGYSRVAYKCPAGYLTIGFGRNIEESGPGISQSEAGLLLRNDIGRSINEIYSAFPWAKNLDERRCEILVQLCFQLGLSRLLKLKKMLAALEANDFERAADELLDSKFARQVEYRAHRLAEIIRNGE